MKADFEILRLRLMGYVIIERARSGIPQRFAGLLQSNISHLLVFGDSLAPQEGSGEEVGMVELPFTKVYNIL
jgi:hypothetical protein